VRAIRRHRRTCPRCRGLSRRDPRPRSRHRKLAIERVYLITGPSIFDATCTELATWIRGHWDIENRLHHVRDRTFREDDSKGRTSTLPRDMASLRNLAVSILRQDGQTNIAAALRHTGRDYLRPLRTLGLT
jgi:hypothetical protein